MSCILAIDTSAEGCSVALSLNGEVRELFQQAPRQHTRLLLPMVDELLSAAGLSLHDIDAIAVGAGPGSFTGLRIAVGVAQGLALGADKPIVPVSTLRALAQSGFELLGRERFCCCLDARMDEVYWGVYEISADSDACIIADSVCPPVRLPFPEGVADGSYVGVGPGWVLADRFPQSLQSLRDTAAVEVLPRAAAMARLGCRDFRAGLAVDAAAAQPLYLRDEVAWKKLPHKQ